MNVFWSEDERLAALLEGKLGEHERAAVMAHLADEDDAYEVFAFTAVILREAEGEYAGARDSWPRSGRIPTSPVRERVKRADPRPAGVVLDTLTAEFDALLASMQSPEVRAATRRAFNASPDELREAAMEAARRRDG